CKMTCKEISWSGDIFLFLGPLAKAAGERRGDIVCDCSPAVGRLRDGSQRGERCNTEDYRGSSRWVRSTYMHAAGSSLAGHSRDVIHTCHGFYEICGSKSVWNPHQETLLGTEHWRLSLGPTVQGLS